MTRDLMERLRDYARNCGGPPEDYLTWQAADEIALLRTALEPFARNADAVSLFEALGHIKREHLHDARAALELKNR